MKNKLIGYIFNKNYLISIWLALIVSSCASNQIKLPSKQKTLILTSAEYPVIINYKARIYFHPTINNEFNLLFSQTLFNHQDNFTLINELSAADLQIEIDLQPINKLCSPLEYSNAGLSLRQLSTNHKLVQFNLIAAKCTSHYAIAENLTKQLNLALTIKPFIDQHWVAGQPFYRVNTGLINNFFRDDDIKIWRKKTIDPASAELIGYGRVTNLIANSFFIFIPTEKNLNFQLGDFITR